MAAMTDQALWDEFVQRMAMQYANTKVSPTEVARRAAALADALVVERKSRNASRSCFDFCVEGVDIRIPIDGWSVEQIEALKKVWLGYASSITPPLMPVDTMPEASSTPLDVTWDDGPPEVLDQQPDNLIPFQQRNDDT